MINIEMLLTNKGVIQEKTGEKTMTLEIKSFKELFGDGEITIKSLDASKISEITKMVNNDMFKMQTRVVYNAVCSPDLKDKVLQKSFECKADPFGIVEKLFTINEIKAISEEVAKLSGLEEDGDVIKEIKKQ